MNAEILYKSSNKPIKSTNNEANKKVYKLSKYISVKFVK